MTGANSIHKDFESSVNAEIDQSDLNNQRFEY